MKISDFIKTLQDYQQDIGDQDVVFMSSGDMFEFFDINCSDVYTEGNRIVLELDCIDSLDEYES